VAFGFVWIAVHIEGVVSVAESFDAAINLGAIGCYFGSLGDTLQDEVCIGGSFAANVHDAEPETPGVNEFPRGRSAWMMLEFGRYLFRFSAPAHFHGADHAHFAVDPVFLSAGRAPDDAFIHFDRVFAADAITLATNHARPEFVKDLKSCFVAGKPKLPLKLKGGLSGRLRRHQVCAPKPNRKRRVGGLHHCPGCQRSVGFALAAAKDNRRSAWKAIRLALGITLRANKPVGPTDRFKIFGASGIVRENGLKFSERRWETARVHAIK